MITFLFRWLGKLPLTWLHGIGAVAGRWIYRVSPGYRSRFDLTFAQAGYAGDAALTRRALEHSGRTLTELPWLWMRDSSQTLSRISVSGWDHVEAARATGRGVLFLTPHLGCFEITAQRYASEAPVTVLYSPPRQRWLADIVDGARDRRGLRAAPATLAGVRQLVRSLRRGEAVGILPDQVPSAGEGAWAPLFGRLAYTMTLPARLAQMSGATVLLTTGQRLDGARFHMHVERLDIVFADAPAEQARQINAAMEHLIRACPEQYLWAYNRYKRPAGAPAAESVA
ncbi:lysophospholipid acyltransferase family protein [soil metagenome]